MNNRTSDPLRSSLLRCFKVDLLPGHGLWNGAALFGDDQMVDNFDRGAVGAFHFDVVVNGAITWHPPARVIHLYAPPSNNTSNALVYYAVIFVYKCHVDYCWPKGFSGPESALSTICRQLRRESRGSLVKERVMYETYAQKGWVIYGATKSHVTLRYHIAMKRVSCEPHLVGGS